MEPGNAGEESGKEPGRQGESVRFYVHICGQVRNPGVYEMEPGSRLFQAVELAGGFTEAAAGDYLNMALEVGDGMKITVPSLYEVAVLGQSPGSAAGSGDDRVPGSTAGGGNGQVSGDAAGNREPWIEMPGAWSGETGAEGGGRPGGGEGTSSSGKVNLNTATKEELMTLRGIGEARAEDIIRYREEQGGFGAIEEIMNVSGIKEAAFRKIKDSITVQEGAP